VSCSDARYDNCAGVVPCAQRAMHNEAIAGSRVTAVARPVAAGRLDVTQAPRQARAVTHTVSYMSLRVMHRPRDRMMNRKRDAWKNRNANRCEASSNAVGVLGDTSEMGRGEPTTVLPTTGSSAARACRPDTERRTLLHAQSGLSLCYS
jgi:hypothetical protein